MFPSRKLVRSVNPLDVRAPDGVLLHGWKVRPAQSNGSWVLLFHGVADNRMGVLEPALILLRAGYGVTVVDARAHGESDGSPGTYDWLERNDTRAIVDALVATEHPACPKLEQTRFFAVPFLACASRSRYSNSKRSSPSLCDPAKTPPGGNSANPLKMLRSASRSPRCQVAPRSLDT
jgi:hypothetical protein